MFGACAGAALYRRAAALELGGFDERFFLYLEDVDLALRLRLAGWTCMYEPAVALHAGEGSGGPPERPVARVGGAQHAADGGARVPLVVAAAGPVAPGGLGLARAARPAGSRSHLRGARSALPLLPAMWRERRTLRAATVPIEQAVPPHPLRGHSWEAQARSTSSRTAARKRSGE